MDESSGGSSEDELPDPERQGRHSAASGALSDEDDIGGFIVDEEGKPIERKKKKKTYRFDDSQRQLAEDIFGVAFDYEEFDQFDDKSDVSESDDYDDDEEFQERRKKGRKKKKTTIFDKFEPYDLAMGHYTDQDQEIRMTDVPERMQLRQIPVTTVSEESDELDMEALWIYNHGFTKPSLTSQHDYTKKDCEKWTSHPATVEKIKKVGMK